MKMTIGRRTTTPIAMLVAFATLLVGHSHGALQDYEPFDYSGTSLDGQSGGTGWSGGWFTTGTASLNALSNDGVSLDYPTPFESPATTPTTMGSRVSTGGLATNASTSRLLSQPIDLSVEGSVRYVSALIKRSAAVGDGVANDNVLIEFVDSNGNRRFGFGIAGADDLPWLNHNGSSTPPSGVTITASDTYFMVAKVISHDSSSSDEYFLKVFGTGYDTQVPSTEPATWDVSASQSTAAILDRMRIRIDPGNTLEAPGQVDEIRIGDTWASVIGQANSSGGPGDFNNDGDVDGEDLAQWQLNFGGPDSDADDDGDSDGADFLIWQRNLTTPPAAAASAVPEPVSALLAALAAVGLMARKAFFA